LINDTYTFLPAEPLLPVGRRQSNGGSDAKRVGWFILSKVNDE